MESLTKKRWTHVLVELTGPNDGSHMAGRRAANKMCPNLTFFNQSRAVITLIEYIFAFTLHKKKM